MPMNSRQYKASTYRSILLAGAVALVPIGLVVRFVELPGLAWLSDVGGSLLYQICLILALGALRPRWTFSPQGLGRIALAVLLFSVAVEFLQLWHPPLLEAVRATLLGRLILGNTFLWGDFPPYFIGCGLGWALLKGIRQRFGPSD
jgi:hypothetical protein